MTAEIKYNFIELHKEIADIFNTYDFEFCYMGRKGQANEAIVFLDNYDFEAEDIEMVINYFYKDRDDLLDVLYRYAEVKDEFMEDIFHYIAKDIADPLCCDIISENTDLRVDESVAFMINL